MACMQGAARARPSHAVRGIRLDEPAQLHVSLRGLLVRRQARVAEVVRPPLLALAAAAKAQRVPQPALCRQAGGQPTVR